MCIKGNSDKLRVAFEKNVCEVVDKDNASENKSFKDVDLDLLARTVDGKAYQCPDQFIAKIKVNVSRCFEGEVRWITDQSTIKNRSEADTIEKEKKTPTIALVLESPHREEFFTDPKSKTIREKSFPAMGTTGDTIVESLPDVLLKYILQKEDGDGAITRAVRDIENGDYRLVLVNVIQFQCSLGEPTDRYRDDVFQKCFNDPVFSNDFRKRLKKYRPSIIINCCTLSKKKFSFRDRVQKLINKRFPSVLRLQGYHPSCPLFNKGFTKID